MPNTKINLFTQHSRNWRTNRYVYPVISRRSKGLSIGVNLNPDKACNFDCVYCCVDRTVPATIREVDLEILRDELDHLLHLTANGEIFQQTPFDQTPSDLRRLNDVAFSGDGEPTAYPRFEDACRLAVLLLEQQGLSDAKIVVITNATLLDRSRVAQALRLLDDHNGEIWAKLDAGTQEYYQFIERTSIPLSRVMDNIAAAGRVRPIVIQSLFMRVNNQPPDDAEIAAYVDRLRELIAQGCQIKLVQVYTVARTTAEAYVTPLEDGALDSIARLAAETGLTVETYYGPT